MLSLAFSVLGFYEIISPVQYYNYNELQVDKVGLSAGAVYLADQMHIHIHAYAYSQ